MRLHFFIVEKHEASQTVAAYLRTKLGLPWSKAKQLLERRQVRVAGQPTTDPALRLKAGNRVEVHGFSSGSGEKTARPAALKHATPKREMPKWHGPTPKIIYSDDAIVVVDKPAGLTTMRHPEERAEFGERGKHYLPVTLADLLPGLLGSPDRRMLPVHRIDRDTTGLVVFARTRAAERSLNQQFREHSIDRRYFAVVRGRPSLSRMESHLVRDRGDGRRGTSLETGSGQRAVTHVRVIEVLGAFALVECRLETGRTHQVRIHLGEQGTPLCGETVYDRPIAGSPVPDGSNAGRPMLHAAHLGIEHPETHEWMEWDCPPAEDMQELLQCLRRSSAS